MRHQKPVVLDAYFKLTERGTSIRTEVLAGLTTFLTLAYILFVNPSILAAAGMDQQAVFVATCLAAAFGTAVMGLYANYPIALAPGMGLNAYFAFVVVGGLGFPWEVALGAVFCSGVAMLVLSVLPVREWLINSIPHSQKMAIASGIGLLLALIAMENAGIVVAHPQTLVTAGDLTRPTVLLAAIGFMAMAVLDYRKVAGAILIGILTVTVIGWVAGLSPAPPGIVDAPPDLSPTALHLDVAGAIELGLLAIVFTFLLLDLFDTTGSLVAVLHQAGLLDRQGRVPRLRQALVSDGAATIAGALFGTSTTTSYVESAAGVRVGGRTGLTAMVVAVLFLLALVFAPVATAIPNYATAPAILFVACVMTRALSLIDWEDVTECVPAMVTALAMPFTFSIASGIGMGFIAYALIKVMSGRIEALNPAVAVVAVLFGLKFALG